MATALQKQMRKHLKNIGRTHLVTAFAAGMVFTALAAQLPVNVSKQVHQESVVPAPPQDNGSGSHEHGNSRGVQPYNYYLA